MHMVTDVDGTSLLPVSSLLFSVILICSFGLDSMINDLAKIKIGG